MDLSNIESGASLNVYNSKRSVLGYLRGRRYRTVIPNAPHDT